jgi:hypothetical protein
MPGVTRLLEIDAYGRQTGRQLLIMSGEAVPDPLTGATWSPDSKFSLADELMQSSGFTEVLESVLKNGFEIVTKK